VNSVGSFRLCFFFEVQLEVVRHVDTADHQDVSLFLDFPLCVRNQPAVTSWDAARLQRAPEGAGQSTCCRGDDIVQRGRVGFVDSRVDVVMFGDL
jgi:hypothetical protein